MTEDNLTPSKRNNNTPFFILLIFGIVLTIALSIAVSTADNLIYLGIGAASILAAIISLRWPDLVTMFVVGALYSNVAVVLNRFHGAPSVITLLIPALVIIPFIYYIFLKREKIVINHIVILILVLMVVQFAGAALSIDSRETFVNVIQFIGEGYLLYFLITNVIRSKKLFIQVVWVLLLVGLFLGGLSAYQQITHTYSRDYAGFAQTGGEGFDTGEENLQGSVEQARLSGPIGEKNRYAQIMLMLVPIGLFYAWGEKSIWLKLFALTAGVLSLVGAALAFSRGAAIAFVLIILVMAVMGFIKARQFAVIVILFVGVGLLFPQYIVRLESIPELVTSFVDPNASLTSADSSVRGRVTEMLAASQVWLDHPVFGVGTGMFRYYFEAYQKSIGLKSVSGTRQAHNLYLGIAADLGTLGLLSFLTIFGLVLWELAKARKVWLKSEPEMAALAAGFFLAVTAYLATGLFLHLSYIRYMFLILALSMALVNLSKRENEEIISNS